MEGSFGGAILAFWLGILTSISPCPLATNIAAMSYLGKKVGRAGQVLLSCAAYTLGRAIVYVGLGLLIAESLLSIPGASNFLQKYMNKLLGPILILVGMFLLELLTFDFRVSAGSEQLREKAAARGILGAGLLGVLFALAFCPVSAALFFGSLVPLSIEHRSPIAFPCLYAVGTALPVLAFALLLALGAQQVGKVFTQVSRIEWWARRITGAVFVVAGIYYSLVYIFRWI